jgi:hypothetical protein
MVWPVSNVNYYGEELIQSVRILSIINSVEQAELEGKCNSIGQLDVLLYIFLIFEALEM